MQFKIIPIRFDIKPDEAAVNSPCQRNSNSENLRIILVRRERESTDGSAQPQRI